MDFKKRIFVGSSTESLEIGEKIKLLLESKGYDCRLWNGDFFEYGHSYVEDLVKKIIAYDYAILIGGPDDEVIRKSNGARKLAPRDNIYLEYGLFSGVISPYRTLFLKSKSCIIASDLSGITLAEFDNNDEAVKEVEKWISSRESRAVSTIGRDQMEILPTVGIAVGYYDNFLLRFKEKFKNKRQYGNVRLTICVPDYLTSDIEDYKDNIISRYDLEESSPENIRLLIKESDTYDLDAYDMPSIIKSIFSTVDYIWGIVGDTEDMKRAKMRALDNFVNNLYVLIKGSEWLTKHVKIITFGTSEEQE